ncbi:SHOCT domain-containing protein [Stakelama marina]|uniref:SHOCT domain-containing protein n=1 Tax=Stakelama marina TaxID=2826939 RepID=A0A8T4IK33_9SPHN|nr:hypothetical protein [Stakelama marina]MBR0552709.1 hypothetical protein [Stakelama marina]
MHHYGYFDDGYSAGWMILHGVFWLILLAALVIGATWMLRASRRDQDLEESGREPSALELLDRRYARGEIGREEYLQTKYDLTGAVPDIERKNQQEVE